MKTIYFVTSNPGKVEIMNSILNDIDIKDIKIEMFDYDSPEDKSSGNIGLIASLCAKHCADKFGKEILTTDGGLFIEGLKGFPGVNTGFTLRRVGIEGILKLMQGVENKKAYYEVATAYCSPWQEPKVFVHRTDFTVIDEKRGENGFGFDPILIPIGYEKTLAEDISVRDKVLGYRPNFINFLKWYNAKN